MKNLLLVMMALIIVSDCGAAEPIADFYLATNGSDHWSGTLAQPNTEKTDGPFATLQRARDAVRLLKKQKLRDIKVLIREGTYRLDKTVVFGLEDSGSGDATVTYEAYPGETPIFSSGQEITGWKKVEGTIPRLPQSAQGNVWVANVSSRFLTLYDKVGMLPRARSEGFIPPKGGKRDVLHFPPGKLKKWSNITDVEVVVRPHHAWIVNVLPLASVDVEQQLVRTSIDATYAMNEQHFLKDQKINCAWLENVLEELNEPGEWVLNTQEGKVYLWPRSDSSPNKSPIVSPALVELIRVEGDIDLQGPSDVPVRNICFRGLIFSHGDRYTILANDAGLQHDWDFLDKANALVRLRGTENCVIDQCHFVHSGSNAIRVDLHGQNNKLSNNKIEHMGAGGIVLAGYGPGTKDVNQNNTVYNNNIHHTGRIFLHAPGILVWQSGENRVANNLVHNTPYTGIIISGCTTEFFKRRGRELYRTIRQHEIENLPRNANIEDVRPFLHTRNNKIEYNEIHHVMESLGDGNGIYIRGAGPGNIIRRNYIHDLVAPMIMQAAIRTDGGQMDTLIAENLIYRCTSQGILMKLNNRCENNIIVDVIPSPRCYYLALREGPLTGATIKRNIFYSSDRHHGVRSPVNRIQNSSDCVFIDELAPKREGQTEDRRGRALAHSKDADTDFNIYYSAADPALSKTMLKTQQRDGVDKNSRAVDPLFVDPANGDFRFKPNSPAVKMGIVPIDLKIIGLQK